MARLAFAVLVGLVGAAVLHILVLFLVPLYSDHDAWSRLAARAGLYETVMLTTSPGGARPLIVGDPLIRAVGCRFDLTDGIARLTAPEGAPFWSLSVFDRSGLNRFSINDRTAERSVDLIVAMPFQVVELRKDLPAEFADSVIVEVPEAEGLIVLRAFAPDATLEPAIAGFLEGANCRQR